MSSLSRPAKGNGKPWRFFGSLLSYHLNHTWIPGSIGFDNGCRLLVGAAFGAWLAALSLHILRVPIPVHLFWAALLAAWLSLPAAIVIALRRRHYRHVFWPSAAVGFALSLLANLLL